MVHVVNGRHVQLLATRLVMMQIGVSPREFNIFMTRVEENCNDLFQWLRLELLDN